MTHSRLPAAWQTGPTLSSKTDIAALRALVCGGRQLADALRAGHLVLHGDRDAATLLTSPDASRDQRLPQPS